MEFLVRWIHDRRNGHGHRRRRRQEQVGGRRRRSMMAGRGRRRRRRWWQWKSRIGWRRQRSGRRIRFGVRFVGHDDLDGLLESLPVVNLVVVLLAQQLRSAFFFGHISFSKVVTSILQSSLQHYPNNLFVTVLSYLACKNQSKTLFSFKIPFPVFINPEISSLFEVD
jgi:hypothetical protein